MLWTGRDVAKIYSPAFAPAELHAQRNAHATRVNPLLLMARLCVEQALRDCLRTHGGQPTADARDAFEWLNQDLDWTRKRGLIPPPDARLEFVFSFSWCCSLLDLDPEDIRQHGLCRLSGLAHNSKQWLPGLPGIREHWARAKEEHEARIAQAQQHQQEEDELLAVLAASI